MTRGHFQLEFKPPITLVETIAVLTRNLRAMASHGFNIDSLATTKGKWPVVLPVWLRA
jgi:hypothetical protein